MVVEEVSEFCAMTPKQVFIRDATGLVKQLGFTDQFLLQIATINPVYAFVFAPLYAPYFFPGAYLPYVYVLGFIQAFAIFVVYAILNRSMPRSGGDYVWTTRILGPLAGSLQIVFFMGALVFSIAAFSISSADTIGLAQLFFSLGISTRNPNLLATSSAMSQAALGFPITALLIVMLIVVLLLGLRAFVWFQRFSFVIYFITIAAFLIVPLSMNPSGFPATFDSAMKYAGSNATYNGVLQQAASGGFLTTGFDWNNTLLASMPWGFWSYAGYQWGTYMAGETKNAKDSLTKSMFASLSIALVLFVAVTVVTYNALGFSFLNAASFIQATNPTYFPTLPAVNMLLSLDNPLVAVILSLGVMIGFILVTLGNMIVQTRVLFAASFDGLFPHKMADVNDRFHSPHVVVLILGALYLIISTIFWYAGFAISYLNTSLILPFGAAIPFVAALVFYFVKPELYKQTLGTSKGTLAALIVASVVGIASFEAYLYAETVPISSGIYLGTSLALAFEVVGVFLVLGILIYALARLRLRQAGVDFSRVYAEIPPE